MQMNEIYLLELKFDSLLESAIQNNKKLNLFIERCKFFNCISQTGAAVYNNQGNLFCEKLCIFGCQASKKCSSIFSLRGNSSIGKCSICYCTPRDNSKLDDVLDVSFNGKVLLTQTNFSFNVADEQFSGVCQSINTSFSVFSFLCFFENKRGSCFELAYSAIEYVVSFVTLVNNAPKIYLINTYIPLKMHVISMLITRTKEAKKLIASINKNDVIFSNYYYDGDIHPESGAISGLINKKVEIPLIYLGVDDGKCDGFFKMVIKTCRNGCQINKLLSCFFIECVFNDFFGK